MPVERRTTSRQVTTVVVAVVVVLLVGLAGWGLVQAASNKDSGVSLRLGDDVFDAGNAVRLSGQVAKDGPVLFSDVSGRGQSRPIFVNHFGSDPQVRWVAFTAVAPGAEKGCYLAWNAKRNLFEERQLPTENASEAGRGKVGELCRSTTWAANGQGLIQFSWQVDKVGDLQVDLRKGAPSSTAPPTTAPPTTPPTSPPTTPPTTG
jgi:hypothetical protein